MASSFFALFDDIATLLDDIAVLSKVAAQKTTGVLGDDLALNAQQVAGVRAERELPVVFAVGKGALVNKAILIPLALGISAFLPWAITPLLMLGGAYLCFEGVEKIFHAWSHRKARSQEHELARLEATTPETLDLAALEKDKVKGAIRTDFVLSAEIIVITLGTVADKALLVQLAVLCAVGVLMTFGVYGLVGLIVKLDDIGMHLLKKERRPSARAVGRFLLGFAPRLMKSLSMIGTVAMFLVGGGILMHGIHANAHLHGLLSLLPDLPGLRSLASSALDLLAGILAGSLVLGLVTLLSRLRSRP